MSPRSLGDFEQLVLLAILRIGDGAYGVPIIEEIRATADREVSHAAVYIALRRLEKKGLVRSRRADPTNRRGGRAKRFFEVEAEALPMLRDQRDALLAMWEGLKVEL
ncbi:MAG: PadR family transcriptional regulator [Gemmatimonadetes bacterium]|nr:PadR family transcriptional regulator [Gemmatimonadota bacterium]